MLNNYIFLGLGNSYEGYTLLSGNNLEKSFLFPRSTYSTMMTISPNQFVDNNYQETDYTTFCIPSGDTIVSGRYEVLSGFDEHTIIDVNGTMKYNFKTTDIVSLKTSFNYYKKHNILNNNEAINSFEDPIILVSNDLLDLQLIESHSENLYEYLEQFNVTLTGYLTQGTISGVFYDTPINFPVSNYGKDLSTSSVICTFEYGDTINPFFGIETKRAEYNATYLIQECYRTGEGDDLVFHHISEPEGYDFDSPSAFVSFFEGFSFKEPKYVLSGNNNVATLYKMKENHFPIGYSDNSIDGNNILKPRDFGKFEILSGGYLNKSNSFLWKSTGAYNIGDWLSGLHYTSGMMTNVSCPDFTIQQVLPLSSNYNYYPSLIGCRDVGVNTNYDYEKINNALNTIQKEPDLQIYVAIDPQSYVIAI